MNALQSDTDVSVTTCEAIPALRKGGWNLEIRDDCIAVTHGKLVRTLEYTDKLGSLVNASEYHYLREVIRVRTQ